ncbi:MAG: hypothetical protein HY097_00615, partial [Nitrospinae bacterium]|nr:hypothetical protein [Nitrospinota bacterium]
MTGTENQTVKISLERIIKIICEQNKITEKELAGSSRNRKLSECRGIICWLAKKINVSTLSKIGV